MSNHFQQIIPMLTYENGIAAMEWLCRVFGFTEKTRMLDDKGGLAHGELTFGTGIVMIASHTPHYQGPRQLRKKYAAAEKWYEVPFIINGVLVIVDDVEKHYTQAREQGAFILTHIEFGGPGTRYRAEDLEGQRWMFMQRD